jgi:hypothetical protein
MRAVEPATAKSLRSWPRARGHRARRRVDRRSVRFIRARPPRALRGTRDDHLPTYRVAGVGSSRQIERSRLTAPLLSADLSISKRRRWLSLARPSGHRADSPTGFPGGRASTLRSEAAPRQPLLRASVCGYRRRRCWRRGATSKRPLSSWTSTASEMLDALRADPRRAKASVTPAHGTGFRITEEGHSRIQVFAVGRAAQGGTTRQPTCAGAHEADPKFRHRLPRGCL